MYLIVNFISVTVTIKDTVAFIRTAIWKQWYEVAIIRSFGLDKLYQNFFKLSHFGFYVMKGYANTTL